MSAKPSSQRTPVFQQKFQVPGGDRKLVSRDALIRRIRDNPAVHCFLVQAPAGQLDETADEGSHDDDQGDGEHHGGRVHV